MKTICYHGSPSPVETPGGVRFEAGVPVECEDALADSLLVRSDFSEVTTQDAQPTPEPEAPAEPAPNTDAQGEQAN